MPTPSLFSTYNYLVPAAGSTSAYVFNNVVAPVIAQPVDFNVATKVDSGIAFTPSGVLIDNTAGTIAVTITILPTQQKIICPIGAQMAVPYAAPNGHTALMIANGANIIFVDYPVIPYGVPIAPQAGAVQAVNVVNGANTQAVKAAATAAVAADPAAVVALSPNTPLPAGANNIGTVSPGADYPTTSTPVHAQAVSAGNTALVATMPAVAAKTNYVTGFEITGGGATAAALIAATLVGALGGTIQYSIAVPAGATLAIPSLIVEFTKPVPASAVNTAVTLNVPAFGAGNTAASCALHGYVM